MRDADGRSKCFGFVNSENADDAVKATEAPDEKDRNEEKEKNSSWEDDDDVDLFSEKTEEEKKAAKERAVAIKVSGIRKESCKSSVLATDHAPPS